MEPRIRYSGSGAILRGFLFLYFSENLGSRVSWGELEGTRENGASESQETLS